ncbi:MAG: hypothetical protein Q4F97_02820 [Bacteroidales bacterium]|nr:hypothetical protein [Bacteroidales bacterium]
MKNTILFILFLMITFSCNDNLTNQDDSPIDNLSLTKSSGDDLVDGGQDLVYLYSASYSNHSYFDIPRVEYYHYVTFVWNSYPPIGYDTWRNCSMQIQYKNRDVGSDPWINAKGENGSNDGIYSIFGFDEAIEISATNFPYCTNQQLFRIRLINNVDNSMICNWSSRISSNSNMYGYNRPNFNDPFYTFDDRMQISLNTNIDNNTTYYYAYSFADDNNKLLNDPKSCNLEYNLLNNPNNDIFLLKDKKNGKITIILKKVEKYYENRVDFYGNEIKYGPYYRDSYSTQWCLYSESDINIAFRFN